MSSVKINTFFLNELQDLGVITEETIGKCFLVK